MIINGKKIDESHKPYLIAELSANHGGSIERAKESIRAAAKTGISAVKIQSYTPDSMTIKCNKKDFFYHTNHRNHMLIEYPQKPIVDTF